MSQASGVCRQSPVSQTWNVKLARELVLPSGSSEHATPVVGPSFGQLTTNTLPAGAEASDAEQDAEAGYPIEAKRAAEKAEKESEEAAAEASCGEGSCGAK